jgi:hypothetical protein
MVTDASGHHSPTRRDYLPYGGGLLAGCTGDEGSVVDRPRYTNTRQQYRSPTNGGPRLG